MREKKIKRKIPKSQPRKDVFTLNFVTSSYPVLKTNLSATVTIYIHINIIYLPYPRYITVPDKESKVYRTILVPAPLRTGSIRIEPVAFVMASTID